MSVWLTSQTKCCKVQKYWVEESWMAEAPLKDEEAEQSC